MKMLRGSIALALVCGLSGIAKASAIGDFQMIVIDPAYSVNTITSTSFSFSFSPCVSPGQIVAGTSYIGCFTGQNETSSAISGLYITVPTIPLYNVACAPFAGGSNYFSTITCGTTASGYYLSFTNGSIPVNSVFTIAESGIDPSVFPVVQVNAATPEPSSLWLLSTGMLGAGFYLSRRQRHSNALLNG